MLEILEACGKERLEMCRGVVGIKSPKLPSFEEVHSGKDFYLRRLERFAIAQKWSRDIWTTNLSALLKGRTFRCAC